MKFRALATDYDGTIAHDGIVDEATVEALRRARTAGLALLLVTGRELPSLFDTFPDPDVFDLIVAENGAVLYDPRTREVQLLGSAAPPALVEALERARVPLSVGHTIVATVTPFEHEVLRAIHALGLDWHVIFNKSAVMALPSDVTKATGFAAALHRLDLAKEDVVGVGDAENDQAFLRLCGLSVAVANALDTVKALVDVTTPGARGSGVQELIARLLAGEMDGVVPDPQKHRSVTVPR